MPYLTGAKAGDVHESLYWRTGFQGAERKGRWKLLKTGDTWRLFDMQTDIGEHHDVAAQHPADLAALKADWLAWSATMAPPRWGPRNANAAADSAAMEDLVDRYIKGLPVDPKVLLYGGGPE
jgi:hypothetical protein